MKRHRNHSNGNRTSNRSSQGGAQQPRDPRTGEFQSGGGFSGRQNSGNDYSSSGSSYSGGDRGMGSRGMEIRGAYQGGGYEGSDYQSSGYQGVGYQGQGWNDNQSQSGSRRSNGYGEMNWEGDEFESRNAGFRGGSGSDWSEGRYAGRGPKGYTRSDERIKEEISDELTAHGGIDASSCTVEVDGGEVTLEGEVESREMKRMAEDVAEACPGVKQVHNRLRIGSSGNGKSSQSAQRAQSLEESGSRFSGSQTTGEGSSSPSRKGSNQSQRS